MTKKRIKQLAKETFEKDNLNQKKLALIIGRLKKTDARAYIQALKQIVQGNTVFVHSPVAVDETAQKQLELKFPNKKMIYVLNKNLLAGMKILDNDLLYDYSLETKIDRVVKRAYDLND